MTGLAALILSALLPIVFVVVLGWIAGATGAVPRSGSAVLAAFVVKFALPVALFLGVARTRREDILNVPYLATLFAGLVLTYALGYACGRLLSRRGRPESAMQGLTCGFANMAYCGPPVLVAAVGQGATLAVVVGNLVTSLVLVPLTLVLLGERRAEPGSRAGTHALVPLADALRKPLVFLPVAGVVVALLGIPLPDVLYAAGDQIGCAAGGAALFTLGLILSGITFALEREVVINVAIQNLVQPALILLVRLALGLRGDPLRAVFLIGVLPSATENAIVAIATDVYPEKAASSVMASTLFSVLSISAGLVLVDLYL